MSTAAEDTLAMLRDPRWQVVRDATVAREQWVDKERTGQGEIADLQRDVRTVKLRDRFAYPNLAKRVEHLENAIVVLLVGLVACVLGLSAVAAIVLFG